MNRIGILAVLLAACTTTSRGPGGDEPATGPEGDGFAWSKRAYPTGSEKTSAVLVSLGVPREIQSGQRYEYEIRVKNLTAQKITQVVLSDTAPPEFQVAEGSPEAAVQAGMALWTLGDLDGGAETSVRASCLAESPGEFHHVCHVTWEAPLMGATLVTLPRLALVKRSPEVAVLADGVVYTYEIANEGTGTAKDVRIEEQLPTGLTTADGREKVEIAVGSLAAGGSKVFTVACSAAGTGVYRGQARATGFGGLEAASGEVAVQVTRPVLEVSAEAPARAAIGQVFTLTVRVRNTGDGPCRDLSVEQTMPQGASFVEASDGGKRAGGVVRWRLGALEAGAEKTVTARFRAMQAMQAPTETTVMGHGAESAGAQAQTELYGIATVELEVKDLLDPIEVGQAVTYVVTVTNQGTAAGTNLKLVCMLEEGMAYQSSIGATAGTAEGGTITFASVAELPPKQTLSWEIVVLAGQAGDHRFRVALTGDQFERPVEGAEATKFYE